ncbi:pilus assembly protein [Stigmatella sp. ncwal1]|uniref:Pilus assembly protein n=1 Tax=Stigmatella ashevillensis TaxID=2995309 RepID=A0ABT5D578_9BACT|nr:TadE/TadG family type IV pilus assembly protein [Stigmatella ashevillena]MDC0708814.1 pilus assembly protein [Stigmatella ashevillena]
MSPLRSSAQRGTATVEFALIVPVLVAILMFSMYLTELVRAKLKLQELARYAAWEMTSYTLSDFAKAKHDEAFDTAQREAMAEALERYKDMDSVEPDAVPGNFIARYSDVKGTLSNEEIGFFEKGLVLGNSDEGFASMAVGALNRAGNGMLGAWDFNTKGWVTAEVDMRFNNVLLPRNYLDEGGAQGFFKTDMFGGKELESLALKSRFSLYADAWTMEDGGDAVIRGRRAGAHRGGSDDMPHGIYQQVSRMVFLGVADELRKHMGIIAQFETFLRQVAPAFLGTFVVSHNYGPTPSGEDEAWSRDCIGPQTGVEAYPADAEGGLNNLDKFSQLDWPRPKCFDTAPFRDQPYERSQYIKIFKARGAYFMGCKNPQSDDPSAPVVSNRGDSNVNVVNCE